MKANSAAPWFPTSLLLAGCALIAARAADAPDAAPPPPLETGPGYYAILPGKVLLASALHPPFDASRATVRWCLESGPGEARIERPAAPVTWATVDEPGSYLFRVSAADGATTAQDAVRVHVYPAGSGWGNPILPGMFPDPHVLVDEGRFHIYATSMENDQGAYGRASVWSSDDFVHWSMKLTNWPEFGNFGGDIWAPDIIRMGKRYYQFVTRSGSYDTWIGVADHPQGPWSNLREDNTAIVSGGGKAGRIVPAYNMDAQPFIDDDGQAYMYWGWAESMAAKLTPDLRDIDGPVHFLKGTKWLPDGGELPQWLTVDLGRSLPLTKIVTCPEFRDVAYGYRIEASEDGQTWATLADRTANTTLKAGDGYLDEVAGRGRHVRITMTSCGGHWAGLYDFAIHSGERQVSSGRSVTASSTRGPGSEPARAVDASNGPQLDDFVEGSYMIKHRGTYYLLYSTGALHDGSYSVHYAMGRNPLGPFTRPDPNIVLRMNKERTTKGPGHNSVLELDGRHYIVYHQHNQPHEDAGGVFRQTCADRLEFNPDGTIREVTPTQTGVGPLRPPAADQPDLARGCQAAATSVRGAAYVPEYALDHNHASKWRAADNTYPQTLTVDLGAVRRISGIDTSFEYPTLAYRYRLETSLDGTTWTRYADHTASFEPAVSPRRDRREASASRVRITITACQRPENGAGIHGFEVLGE